MTDKFIEAFTALDPSCKQVVRLKLAHPTATNADLARLYDPPMTRQAMHEKIKLHPEIQECLSFIEMDAIRSLQSLYPMAIVTLKKLLMSKNEFVQADVAKFVLKKVADSEHVLPDRIDDAELQFIYEDIVDQAKQKEGNNAEAHSENVTEESKEGSEKA